MPDLSHIVTTKTVLQRHLGLIIEVTIEDNLDEIDNLDDIILP